MWIFISIVFLIAFILIFNEIRERKLLETVTKSNRGTSTERDLVLSLLKHGIPAETIFHDLYLKKHNGNFCQIDLIIITEVGIIVFEVKDYSGWIFGAGHNSQWTQVLAYGKRKYRLYNPIIQNSKHINDLKKQLRQLESIPFYSIVVFYGNCVLKEINYVPNGTFLTKSNRVLEVVRTIMKNNNLASYIDKDEILQTLKEAVKNGEDKETQIQHIKNIRDMLGKDRIFD